VSVFQVCQRACSVAARSLRWHLPGPEFDSRWERTSLWPGLKNPLASPHSPKHKTLDLAQAVAMVQSCAAPAQLSLGL
jgi:hypothetical protein